MLGYVAFLILLIIFELNMAALVRPIFAIVLAAAIAADSSCSTRDFIMEDSDLVKKRKRLEKERSESCFKRNGPDTFGPSTLNWNQYFYFSDC